MEGVLDACFLLFHLGFGSCTDVDDGNTAGEFRKALLELLAIVIAGGFFDLTTDLVDPAGDGFGSAAAFDDDGGILADGEALCLAEIAEFNGLELDAEIVGDDAATGEDSDVFEHGLAAVAEARCFHSSDVEDAAELVDHESRKGFAIDVFGDDDERLAGFGDLLEEREHVLERADLLLVDENERVLEGCFHGLRIGDEVRAEVAFVELHTFDDVEGSFDAFGFFNGDGAVLADLVHCLGDDAADFLIPVCGDGGDLCDFLGVGDSLGDFCELGDDGLSGFHDAALKRDRVCTGGDVAEAFFVDGFSKHGCGGGSVTGDVGCFGGNLTDELCAHVFVRALEFDFLGNGDTVLGDRRGTEFLVEDDVASGRPEGRLDGTCEFFNTAQECLACCFVE